MAAARHSHPPPPLPLVFGPPIAGFLQRKLLGPCLPLCRAPILPIMPTTVDTGNPPDAAGGPSLGHDAGGKDEVKANKCLWQQARP